MTGRFSGFNQHRDFKSLMNIDLLRQRLVLTIRQSDDSILLPESVSLLLKNDILPFKINSLQV